MRLQAIAPKRDTFPGITVAGHYITTNPPVLCEVLDQDTDEGKVDGVLRIGRKTYARFLRAQQDGRLILTADPGERAAADGAMIAKLQADLDRAESKARDLEARCEAIGSEVEALRKAAQADAASLSKAREEEAAQRRRADDLQSKLDAVGKPGRR